MVAVASDLRDMLDRRSLPPLDPGILPPPYFEFGKVRHQAPTSVRDPDVTHAEAATASACVPAPPEGLTDWKQLTRKQRKAVCYICHPTEIIPNSWV